MQKGQKEFHSHLTCVANSLRWKEWPQKKVNTQLALVCLLLTLSACSCRRSFSGLSTITSARVVFLLNGAVRNECVCVPTSTKSPSAAFDSLIYTETNRSCTAHQIFMHFQF